MTKEIDLVHYPRRLQEANEMTGFIERFPLINVGPPGLTVLNRDSFDLSRDTRAMK